MISVPENVWIARLIFGTVKNRMKITLIIIRSALNLRFNLFIKQCWEHQTVKWSFNLSDVLFIFTLTLKYEVSSETFNVDGWISRISIYDSLIACWAYNMELYDVQNISLPGCKRSICHFWISFRDVLLDKGSGSM